MPSIYEITADFDAWLERVQAIERPSWAADDASYLTPGADGKSALEAEKEDTLGKLPEVSRSARGGTLVISVGSRLQPALLSVAVHEPACLVLAISDTPVGCAQADKLATLLPRHIKDVRRAEYDPTDPIAAWERIAAALDQALRPDRPIVFDITGGKKSMAAAAFFLAVERQVPSVYLDGEDYSAELGRPRPGTLGFAHLSDPAAGLALTRHKHIQAHWSSRAFAAAAAEAEEVAEHLKREDRLRHHAFAYQRAATYARAAHAWSQGRYDLCAALLEKVDEQPHASISELCREWPDLSATGNLDEALCRRPSLLWRYLADAWRWLTWQEEVIDPRLAFLRYFALGEFAMEGLLAAALAGGSELEESPGLSKSTRKNLKRTRDDGVWRFHDGRRLALLLGCNDKSDPDLGFQLKNWSGLPEANPWHDDARGWRSLRNKCAHNVGEATPEHIKEIRLCCRELLVAGGGRLPYASGITEEISLMLDTTTTTTLQPLSKFVHT
ncbi:hypothetical protein L6R53_16760 [Myxococcota bacterium]|nr:hypothetical protein [Myxococcota bacterium]